ncbi:hypothetical protein Syun_008645 [Stephania yunnanensis]|uniref:Uncharacterized protein n=1 Tax=Stephania yunnanensis TaxID=152371 RepID=A0AAP0KCY4_9MAGN
MWHRSKRAGVRGWTAAGENESDRSWREGEAEKGGGDGRQERGREGLGFKAGPRDERAGRETERKDAERGSERDQRRARIERDERRETEAKMRERREQFRLFWGFGVVLAFSEERERERETER